MRCKDREGNFIGADDGQDKFLEKLYSSRIGRQMVKVLIRPSVSKAGGWFLDRKISTVAIKPFVKTNGISLEDYEKNRFDSYNDFFTRRVKAERRPVDMDSSHLIAPCDSKLTVYQITEDAEFTIKNTLYSMESLTRSKKLAEKYRGGYLLLFRLTVDDYHRYCYVDRGKKSGNHIINGVFHTVNPIANDHYPIYKENTRCISFLKSANFGTLMMIEVGALMVGKIVNYHEEQMVERGEEKGRFEFGGSTIILCLKKDKAVIDDDILENSRLGIETKVRYGEKIGKKNGIDL